MTSAAQPEALAEELRRILRGSPWFMAALQAVRSLQLPDACIGAGAVRNLVWDHLHGHDRPSALADVDVVYFDDSTPDPGRDAQLQARLHAVMPGVPWEVTNQAWVHTWFEGVFGHPVAPLTSLHEAVASWPEYATAVAVCLGACRAWGAESENRPQRGQFLPVLQPHSPAMGQKDGEKWTAAVDSQPATPKSDGLLAHDGTITVIAPHGLEDLFALRVRRNPARVSVETYRERLRQKAYTERWPRVTIEPA